MMTVLVMILLIPLLAILLDSPVGRALAGRLERKGLAEAPDAVAERLAFLEGEVERLSTEVLRLEEDTQFLQKLLEGRSENEALPAGDQDD